MPLGPARRHGGQGFLEVLEREMDGDGVTDVCAARAVAIHAVSMS
jgi:hypothetical protein